MYTSLIFSFSVLGYLVSLSSPPLEQQKTTYAGILPDDIGTQTLVQMDKISCIDAWDHVATSENGKSEIISLLPVHPRAKRRLDLTSYRHLNHLDRSDNMHSIRESELNRLN